MKINEQTFRVAAEFDYYELHAVAVNLVITLAETGARVIFVLRHDFTKIGSVQLAKKNLKMAGANIIGCVFNAFNADMGGKHSDYYHNKH